MTLIWASLLYLSSTPALACEKPVPLDDLLTTMDGAEHALSIVDIGGFKAATVKARQQLECVDEPLTRHAAAQFHRIEGLRAFGEREEGADLSFAAAKRIEPRYRFPSSLVPKGNPILAAYDLAQTEVEVEEAPPPRVGFLNIDGRTTRERPVGLPAVFQRLDDKGGIIVTSYLAADASVPDYEARPEGVGPTGTLPEPDPLPEPKLARNVMLGGAIGSALLAGGLYGAALSGKARYVDVDTGMTDGELDDLERRVNAMATTSGILGVTAAGLGVAVAFTW